VTALAARGASPVLGLIISVGGLIVMIATFYLVIKIAGLVDAIKEKVKEMKL